MDSIKYLKLDLRIIKGKIKVSLILPIFIGMMVIFMNNTAIAGIGYLLFLLIGLATVPFDSSISENSNEMYGLFPAKVSSMVLGRFIYLVCAALIIFFMDTVIIEYLYKVKAISMNGIIGIFLSEIITLAICFCQYPIYYKLGIEKGKILSIMIYLIPGIIVFSLTSFISKNNVNTNSSEMLNFILNNRLTLLPMGLIMCTIIGIISYLISCNICAKKELQS